MDAGSFSQTVTWVMQHGYPLLFLAMLIEGPIITSAAAFAASLGYLDVRAVLLLSFLGDTMADIGYYAIGFWGRQKVVERYGHRIGLSRERLERIESFLQQHTIKTLVAIKLAPIIPGPGLMAAGATRIPFRKLAMVSVVMTIPKSLAFFALGYYFGEAYEAVSDFVEYGQYTILMGIIATIALYIIYKKVSASIARRMENL